MHEELDKNVKLRYKRSKYINLRYNRSVVGLAAVYPEARDHPRIVSKGTCRPRTYLVAVMYPSRRIRLDVCISQVYVATASCLEHNQHPPCSVHDLTRHLDTINPKIEQNQSPWWKHTAYPRGNHGCGKLLLAKCLCQEIRVLLT